MSSFTHTVLTKCSESPSDCDQSSKIEVGTVALKNQVSFAGSVTDQLMTIAFSVTNLQSLFLSANNDLTIKTNSSGSPANTLHLKAGSPLVWGASDGYFAKPLGTDVTAFYVTTGPSATRLVYRILTN